VRTLAAAAAILAVLLVVPAAAGARAPHPVGFTCATRHSLAPGGRYVLACAGAPLGSFRAIVDIEPPKFTFHFVFPNPATTLTLDAYMALRGLRAAGSWHVNHGLGRYVHTTGAGRVSIALKAGEPFRFSGTLVY